MALSLSLVPGETGFTPDYVDVTAAVTLVAHSKDFKISRSHLRCETLVPSIDPAMFRQHAETAKTNCPVSQALAGVQTGLHVMVVGAASSFYDPDPKNADPNTKSPYVMWSGTLERIAIGW